MVELSQKNVVSLMAFLASCDFGFCCWMQVFSILSVGIFGRRRKPSDHENLGCPPPR
jgi:hypothetical protein